jgi:hypothetical protein
MTRATLMLSKLLSRSKIMENFLVPFVRFYDTVRLPARGAGRAVWCMIYSGRMSSGRWLDFCAVSCVSSSRCESTVRLMRSLPA